MDWTNSDLDNLPTRIWTALSEASGKPSHPFRTPALGTTDRFDTNIRTVVLRRVDPEYRWLVFYTDVRSSKVRDIRKNQQVQWLFHHPGQGIQIRATSAAMVYWQDAMARDYWDKLPLARRVSYMASQMPGDALMEPSDTIPEEYKDPSVTEKALEAGYKNFAAITCEVDQFDWLHLDPKGHRRASIRWTGAKYSSIWLVP